MPIGPDDYANRTACRPGNYARTTRPVRCSRGELSPGKGPVRQPDGQLCQDNQADPVDDAGQLCRPASYLPRLVSGDRLYVLFNDRATMPADAINTHVPGNYARKSVELSTTSDPAGQRETPGNYANRHVASTPLVPAGAKRGALTRAPSRATMPTVGVAGGQCRTPAAKIRVSRCDTASLP